MSTASGKGVENHTNHLCMALETLVHAHGCSRNLIFWIVDDHDLGRIDDLPFAGACGTRHYIGDVVEHFRIARIPQHGGSSSDGEAYNLSDSHHFFIEDLFFS